MLTDVLEAEKHVFIRPLLIALPNRHNVLIDQETNTLAGWWTGDAALERTRGKSWYWEPSGTPFWPLAKPAETDITLRLEGKTLRPEPHGQHIAPFDSLEHVPDGIRFEQPLAVSQPVPPRAVSIFALSRPSQPIGPKPRNSAQRISAAASRFAPSPTKRSLQIDTLPGQRIGDLPDRM